MELNKCNRCGAFYVNGGDVCPKCAGKDNLELDSFKSYIQENGISSIDTMATQTGISQKNVIRFLGYQGVNPTDENLKMNLDNTGVVLN